MLKNPVKSWSYSAWSTYDQCPYKYYLSYIKRIKEPENEALRNGKAKHKDAEMFVESCVCGQEKPLMSLIPDSLKLFRDDFEALTIYKDTIQTESEWCFDINWKPVSWFSKDAWLRIKVDLLRLSLDKKALLITDYKTGKVRDGYQDQLMLYALGGFLLYPEVSRVVSDLWYLEHGAKAGGLSDPAACYPREQLKDLKEYWLMKSKPMFEDTEFKQKKNFLCRGWCWYRKNGHCNIEL